METTTEYVVDEQTNKLKIVKKKVNEKNVPPNTDLIKLIYSHYVDQKTDFEEFSDEELEEEKQRLLKELKEKESGSTKSKNKN